MVNLTNDSRFSYSWDGENRLLKVESLASTPVASRRKVEWQYDGMGQRIRQTEYDGSSGSWVVVSDIKMVYDGWQCIAEMNATNNTVLRSYVWGTDLSGTQTGAGGVGGLVMMTIHTGTNAGTYFPAYDGNGNVSALVNASNGEVTANYEYGPFGEPIRVSCVMSRENPYRFSTKLTVDSIDIILYEYRPYKPSTGTWLTRDPIGEKGGRNLYGFLFNNPMKYIDTDGRIAIADDLVIGGVLIAGGISAWLSTPQGQQWLQETGYSISQAASYIADIVSNAAGKCLCKNRHPSWITCPPNATDNPSEATEKMAPSYPGFNGPFVSYCRYDGPATNCPGDAPGERYYCMVAYWSSLTGRVSMMQYSVNCCGCCRRFISSKSCLDLHLSGGEGQKPPTHEGDK